MDYRFLIDTAIDLVNKRYTNGSSPLSGDTVCAIYAGNGRIYTGMNVYVVQGNIPNNIHAEIDAINRMRADGETRIIAITVFDSCTVSPILPCNVCINLIFSLNYENTGAVVLMHNGTMNIANIGRPAIVPNGNNTNMTMAGNNNYSVYHGVPDTNRGASLYIPPNNPNDGNPYMNNVNTQAHNSYMPQQKSGPIANSVTLTTPLKRSGGSSILKNKLNNLLGDD